MGGRVEQAEVGGIVEQVEVGGKVEQLKVGGRVEQVEVGGNLVQVEVDNVVRVGIQHAMGENALCEMVVDVGGDMQDSI